MESQPLWLSTLTYHESPNSSREQGEEGAAKLCVQIWQPLNRKHPKGAPRKCESEAAGSGFSERTEGIGVLLLPSATSLHLEPPTVLLLTTEQKDDTDCLKT